ncbi:uncharacterized protein [Primulina huaijiensis]|uniref:uncharacterized protein n=1 Tax=Primulina huaijiensis TaxID=1492673 RepID=UPI003CC70814
MLFTCDIALEDQKNIWFLDTGCNNHMCGRQELFTKLDETIRSEVKFENNTRIPVSGKGEINIIAKDGSNTLITYVYYVPGLHQNLLIIGQLSERGYAIDINEGNCTIRDKKYGLIAKHIGSRSIMVMALEIWARELRQFERSQS